MFTLMTVGDWWWQLCTVPISQWREHCPVFNWCRCSLFASCKL